MAWDLTVAGTSQADHVASSPAPRIARGYNERDSASVTFLPGYAPAMHDSVVIYAQDGATKLFAGVVIARRTVGEHLTTYRTEVECAGASIYADWVSTTAAFGTTEVKTLKWILQQLVAYLASDGVTLHASQATGPNVDLVVWPVVKISDCLRELADRTGWTWSINNDLVLRMVEPGTLAAAWTVTEADPHCLTLDWEEADDAYGTKVIIECGGTGTAVKTLGWAVTEAVHDGGLLYFNVPYSVSSDPGAIRPSYVKVTGQPTFSGVVMWGYMPPMPWCWDYANHRLSYDPTLLGALDDAWVIEPVTFTAQFPFTVTLDSGATPVVEYRATSPVTDYASAMDVATVLLAAVHRRTQRVMLTTVDHGLVPGASLDIDVPTWRGLSHVTALIDRVDIDLVTTTQWRYTVSGTVGAIASASTLGVWRAMLGGGAQSVGIAGVTLVGIPVTTAITGAMHAHLGGSRVQDVVAGSWQTIPEYQTHRCVVTGPYAMRCARRTRDAGTTVQVRLYDGTASAVVTTGTATASTSWVEETLSVSLTKGHAYWVEVIGSNTATGVLVGQATVETA